MPQHLGELRDEAVGVAREQRPGRDLVQAAHLAHQREADGAAIGVVEAQLRERDPELGAPAVRVAAHLDVPHRVPAVVARAVVEVVPVPLHANRVDRELVGRSVIEIGIDDHLHPVGGRGLIAPREDADDAVGFAVEGADGDVERIVVERDPRFGAVAGRLALGGLALDEGPDDGGLLPGALVQAAVDDHRFTGQHQRGLRGRVGTRRHRPLRRAARRARARAPPAARRGGRRACLK